MFNTNAQCYQNISQVLLTSAFILWPTCTRGFGIRVKIRCGLRFFGVFLCGFAVFRPPLRPPPRGTHYFPNPPPLSHLQQRFHLVFYTDEQLQLIDISSKHNLPSVLFEFIYPAACYHLRPSPCPSQKCVHHSFFPWKPLVGPTCRRW